MFARNLLYFAFLSLTASPFSLADSVKTDKTIFFNRLTLVQNNKEENLVQKVDTFSLPDVKINNNTSNIYVEKSLLKSNILSDPSNKIGFKSETDMVFL